MAIEAIAFIRGVFNDEIVTEAFNKIPKWVKVSDEVQHHQMN